MVKKILAIILSLLLVIGVFSGCTGDTADQPNKTNEPDSQQTQSPTENPSGEDELEHVTLDWYIGLWKDYPDTDRVMGEVKKIFEEELNTTVNIHVDADPDYKTKVSTMISAGQPMDIVYLSGSTVPFLDNALRGAFLPLEDLLPEYAPNIWETVPQEAWDAVTLDDHIYGIVPMKDLADSFVIMYDPDLSEKYELDVPKPYEFTTVYDIMDFIYAAHDARNQEYPEVADEPSFDNGNLQYMFFNPYELIAQPVAVTIPGFEAFEGMGNGEKVFNIYDTPEYLEFARTMRKFVEDGLFPSDVTNYNKDKAIDIHSPWYLAQGTLVPNANFDAVTESRYQVMSTAYVRAMLHAISVNCENPERALMVLDYANTDPYLGTMLRFGIENEHWIDKGNNQISFEGTTNEDTTNRAYYHWYGAQWGNIVNMYYPENIDPTLRTKINELVGKSNKETNLGFVFDGKPVQNEMAACQNVINEYHNLIKYGKLEDVEDSVAEFVSKLTENGSQKIVDEAQKQLTEWRASVGKPTLN